MGTTHPELTQWIAEGPGEQLHGFPEGVAAHELAVVLTGMANRDGGTILLGVTDDGGIQGVRHIETINDRIFQAALHIDPPLVLPMPRIIAAQPHPIVVITVPPGLPHAFNLDGRYLVRNGIRTEALPPRQLRTLMMGRGVLQFDAQIPEGASLEDLDMEQVADYREKLARPPDEPLDGLLARRGCLRAVNGVMRPTYAALLLFGLHPQQWVPSATILAARFAGVAIADQFVKQEIRGTLPQQLRRAENFVRDQLRSVVRLAGLQRSEALEYPFEAVRELLVNAVAHRDYNLQGDTIHLHIYADRLEVHSPGGLPGPVTLANLLEARFSRNPVIAQVLSDLGYVERLGYGLNRVVTVMRQHHLPEPHFEEAGGTFRVRLRNTGLDGIAPASLPDFEKFESFDLNTRQEQAIGYLLTHKRLTNRAYQELCPDVSSETLRRDLADLVGKGVIVKMGSKRGTYYILK